LPADLALVNADIKTMNPHKPFARAVAITGSKIVKVGTNQEVKKLIGDSTQVINLEGKTIVPGLIDTHVHVADFGRCLMWLDLTTAQSIVELQNMVKTKAEQTSAGRWIIGRGWNNNRFKEKRLLNLQDLDAATSNNPVILYHEAAMICAVNSEAMRLAAVTEQTSPPEAGTIDKNPETGKLTGIFRSTATNLIWQVVPEPDIDELTEASALALQKIVEAGITNVHWLVLSEIEFPVIERLYAEGRLLVRVNVVVPEGMMPKATNLQSSNPLLLRVGGVAVYVDGYLDSKTAALFEPYSDEPGNSGKILYAAEALAASVQNVLVAGLQPVIHAMGDKAVDLALKTIEMPHEKTVRFRMEQAALLNQELIQRLMVQDVVVSVQPKVISTEFTVWSATKSLGAQRAKWLHPLKSLLEAGVKVAGGSDCPMEPLNPLLGLQESVLRPSFPEQRLSMEEALRMYTVDGAYCSSEEAIKGSIEEGKLADLTVLSEDPFTVPSDKISTIAISMTIIDGKVAFSRQ
jgi:predicted amidohydrolase YtcJ